MESDDQWSLQTQVSIVEGTPLCRCATLHSELVSLCHAPLRAVAEKHGLGARQHRHLVGKLGNTARCQHANKEGILAVTVRTLSVNVCMC